MSVRAERPPSGASGLQRQPRAGKNGGVSKYWREEVATQLTLAAEELRARRDGSFVKSLTVAMGYLEYAARSKLSRNAERVWEAVRQSVRETENTTQMKLTPEAMENIARQRASDPDIVLRASDPDIAPPSLPVSGPPKKEES